LPFGLPYHHLFDIKKERPISRPTRIFFVTGIPSLQYTNPILKHGDSLVNGSRKTFRTTQTNRTYEANGTYETKLTTQTNVTNATNFTHSVPQSIF
jgi:hypothetical protein